VDEQHHVVVGDAAIALRHLHAHEQLDAGIEAFDLIVLLGNLDRALRPGRDRQAQHRQRHQRRRRPRPQSVPSSRHLFFPPRDSLDWRLTDAGASD
jgi:hypothetical protein